MNGELPDTEAADPRAAALDLMATPALVEFLAREQIRAVDAVTAQAGRIASVVDEISRRIERGGKLYYAGAGTSGRIASLDAAEIPPTFGTDPSLVRAYVAGGDEALLRAIEGAEDDAAAGEAAMRDVRATDALIGLSASGGAAFVVAAVERARDNGAYTVAIVNSERSSLAAAAGVAIVLATGAEPLAGSTRLTAGTAQKIALNTISTAVMVRLGRVHGNLMVDVVATNRKLRGRALRLVRALTGAGDEEARALLDRAGGRVKIAAVMHRHGVDAPGAAALLDDARGSLRSLL